MTFFLYAMLAVVLLIHQALAFPSPVFQNLTRQVLNRRDIPPIPPRPDNVGLRTFHSNQFLFFEEIGFVDESPAVDAAPVFLFGRTSKHKDPCYPESAVVIGSNPPRPNPGTGGSKGTYSGNPGKDCTDPGPDNGDYSPGNPFPVYVGATFCGPTWRINYDVYYVHDGVLLEGHKHDWEGITVVFRQDPNSEDWWYRDSAIYNLHGWHNVFDWSQIHTVDLNTDISDIRDDVVGTYKKHPKVYVGFHSHGAFPGSCTHCRKYMLAAGTKGIANGEYRGMRWWRLVQGQDMHLWSEISSDWDYGHATSTPFRNKFEMCYW